MAFKRHTPGCLCCLASSTFAEWDPSSRVFIKPDELVPDTNDGLGPEADPVYPLTHGGAIDITDHPELGAGAIVVGMDVDNLRWLIRKTDGSTWTLDKDGEDPQELFGSGADIAAMGSGMIKWHHKWEVGGGSVTATGEFYSFDEDGNFIISPFGPLTAATTFCVDPSGNVYTMGLFGGVNIRVAQNGSSFARGVATAGTDGGQAPYHDGSDLYLVGSGSATGGRGIYRVNGATTATLVTLFDDIFTDTPLSVVTTWWDSHRKRVYAQGVFTTSADEIFFRMKNNGSKLIVYDKHGIVGPGTHIWMAP